MKSVALISNKILQEDTVKGCNSTLHLTPKLWNSKPVSCSASPTYLCTAYTVYTCPVQFNIYAFCLGFTDTKGLISPAFSEKKKISKQSTDIPQPPSQSHNGLFWLVVFLEVGSACKNRTIFRSWPDMTTLLRLWWQTSLAPSLLRNTANWLRSISKKQKKCEKSWCQKDKFYRKESDWQKGNCRLFLEPTGPASKSLEIRQTGCYTGAESWTTDLKFRELTL